MSLNLLMDILPEYVNIDGEEYFIDTNFRNGIIFEKIAFSDIPIKNKVAQLLPIFYTEQMPRNTTVAMETIIGFYSCGVETKKDTAPQRRKNGNVVLKPKMIYDYFHDAPYIYAAFLGNYGIDLNDIEYLHWWKFHALFRGLPSSAKIVEIMGYRGRRSFHSKIRSLWPVWRLEAFNETACYGTQMDTLPPLRGETFHL